MIDVTPAHPDLFTAHQLAYMVGDGFHAIVVGPHRVRWSGPRHPKGHGQRTVVLQELGTEDSTRWQIITIEEARPSTCEVESTAPLSSLAQLRKAIAWCKGES